MTLLVRVAALTIWNLVVERHAAACPAGAELPECEAEECAEAVQTFDALVERGLQSQGFSFAALTEEAWAAAVRAFLDAAPQRLSGSTFKLYRSAAKRKDA